MTLPAATVPAVTLPDRTTFRPATDADRPFLVALYATTRADLVLLPLADDQRAALVTMQYRAQDLHYRRHHPDAAFDVVEVGGRPAGRLYVDEGVADVRIIDISLLPEHRGAGIGSALIRGVQDRAAATGRTVSLHVAADNPAEALYERLGFSLVADLGAYRLRVWNAP